MVMLLADRFASTVAPASAAHVEGGIGVQTSSQISTCSDEAGQVRRLEDQVAAEGTARRWPQERQPHLADDGGRSRR